MTLHADPYLLNLGCVLLGMGLGLKANHPPLFVRVLWITAVLWFFSWFGYQQYVNWEGWPETPGYVIGAVKS